MKYEFIASRHDHRDLKATQLQPGSIHCQLSPVQDANTNYNSV